MFPWCMKEWVRVQKAVSLCSLRLQQSNRPVCHGDDWRAMYTNVYTMMILAQHMLLTNQRQIKAQRHIQTDGK